MTYEYFGVSRIVSGHDRQAIAALGTALAGSDRPLVVTSGTAIITPGRLTTEYDMPTLPSGDVPRVATEEAARALQEQGVRVSLVRLSPSVHGDGDHGFVPMLIDIARAKGVSAYIGDGGNRWTAVHRLDAAHLYRRALENGRAGERYHGVDEEAIRFRDIAEAIGRNLNIPVVAMSPLEASTHFGWIAAFAALDVPASSLLTQQRLDWRPVRQGLLADLDESVTYFKR